MVVVRSAALWKANYDMAGRAAFNEARTHRYMLARDDRGTQWRIVWFMLNPSKANQSTDDPTIRRVVAFSKRLAAQVFGGEPISVIVHNLSSQIATSPSDIDPADDGGDANVDACRTAIRTADAIVVAWGANGYRLREQRRRLCGMLADGTAPIYALGRTSDGEPAHPLRLASATPFLRVAANRGGSGNFAHVSIGGPIS